MGQDKRKGRRTEIDYINGYVVAQAASTGREVPGEPRTHRTGKVGRGMAKADPQRILQAV